MSTPAPAPVPVSAAEDAVRPPLLQRWTQEHARVFFATLGRLWREPVSTLLTAAVIGITLALPAGLHILVGNVSAISYSWEGAVQASLFLRDNVTPNQGLSLTQHLSRHKSVARVQYISREQSLAEFRTLSGFGEALDLLQDNPLPAVIVLTPQRGLAPAALDALMAEVSRLPEIEVAKLDRKWLDRLYAILGIVERAVLIIAAVLALAVIVTVGNTIRLDIEGRRDEIVVMKLIGAPDSFIRRPFLYTGLWYGLAGGVLAWLLVHAALWALAGPARRLAGLYDSSYSLSGLSLDATLLMLAGGVLLGMLGSAWTVGRHLSRYEPS
ncbi:MAG TPA: permease-like cell division protein FtsX [Candidatus Binatia bacterium]|nr:permease-like cell division protein FtsX [Candidatus Binatia bacterium]